MAKTCIAVGTAVYLVAIAAHIAALNWRLSSISRRLARPAADLYELGWQNGHDRGYREGRRVARPSIAFISKGDVVCAEQ